MTAKNGGEGLSLPSLGGMKLGGRKKKSEKSSPKSQLTSEQVCLSVNLSSGSCAATIETITSREPPRLGCPEHAFLDISPFFRSDGTLFVRGTVPMSVHCYPYRVPYWRGRSSIGTSFCWFASRWLKSWRVTTTETERFSSLPKVVFEGQMKHWLQSPERAIFFGLTACCMLTTYLQLPVNWRPHVVSWENSLSAWTQCLAAQLTILTVSSYARCIVSPVCH